MTDSIREPIVVRPASGQDVALMSKWAQAMAFETEHKRLDPDLVARGMAAGVADPGRCRYFIAERAGQPAGTLMFTYEWSDWRCAWWWWLQSVYVAPEHRRKGVYRALYDHVLGLAKAAPDVCGIRLYVERENVNAQRTYQSLGMADSGYLMLETELPRR